VTVGRDRDLVIQCRVRGHPRPKGKIKLLFISRPLKCHLAVRI
jgi:hypothetical protein